VNLSTADYALVVAFTVLAWLALVAIAGTLGALA
jgi:hypothetical protein